jgi:hypothetical protein
VTPHGEPAPTGIREGGDGGERMGLGAEAARMTGALALTGALLVAGGCGAPECPAGLDVRYAGPDIELVDEATLAGLAADTAVIADASVTGNSLRLAVVYTGGCEAHAFTVHAARSFRSTDPPEIDLYLGHDAHGDACESSISEEKFFGLISLKEAYRREFPDDNRLILRVHEPGASEPARLVSLYKF